MLDLDVDPTLREDDLDVLVTFDDHLGRAYGASGQKTLGGVEVLIEEAAMDGFDAR